MKHFTEGEVAVRVAVDLFVFVGTLFLFTDR